MELGPLTAAVPPTAAPAARRPAALAVATVVTALAVLGALLAPVGQAGAATAARQQAAPTTLALSGTRVHAGEPTTLRVELTSEAGDPVPGATVAIERRVDGAWTALTTVVTDASGQATAEATLQQTPSSNTFRADYAGDATWAPSSAGPVRVELRRHEARVGIGGPRTVVDGRRLTLRVRARTASGSPLTVPVRVQQRRAGERRWRTFRVVRTGGQGVARVRLRPRVDTRWRARVAASAWHRADTSRVHRIDNLPPGEPVRLPAGAPAPRIKLPPQPRAVGEGAHPVVSAIPDGVWRSMVGRSWHAGCPVGRAGLRLLRINYWGYDGYRYRGEVVAASGAVDQMSAALAEMYRRELPIRAMYRVDRFGWSSRLQGADDYASMAAGNTSAFNCRHVVGRPGVRSPHSYGRSLDLNTWENPFHSSHGWTPNAWWAPRSHPRVAWRSRSHPVVAVMLRHGFHWTYGTGDSQHFDAGGTSGRVIVPRGCVGAESCK